jgi:hypothetical protein
VGALVLAVLCVTARRSPGLLAGVAAVTGTTTLGYAAARAADAGTAGAVHVVPVVVGAGMLVAALLSAARRPIADFVLAVSGAAVAVFAGFADSQVFSQAVAPVPGPGWWARLAVLVALGAGTGLAAAGALRLRVPAPTSVSGTPVVTKP